MTHSATHTRHSTTTHRGHMKQRTTTQPPHTRFDNLFDKEPCQKIGGNDTQPIRNQPKAAPYTEKLLRLRSYSTTIIQLFTATLLKKQSYPKKSLLWTGLFFCKVTINSDSMVTLITPNASLCQLATRTATCSGNGMVTPFGIADKVPVAKRKRFTTHSSPMLLHAFVDLQHAMTDVVNNGIKELVDDKG